MRHKKVGEWKDIERNFYANDNLESKFRKTLGDALRNGIRVHFDLKNSLIKIMHLLYFYIVVLWQQNNSQSLK